MGVFCKKSGNWVFVNIGPSLNEAKYSSVGYQYFFILHFPYWGVRTHPTHPTAYGLVEVQNAENGVILGHPKSSAMTGDSIERIRLLFDFNRNSAPTCTVFEI